MKAARHLQTADTTVARALTTAHFHFLLLQSPQAPSFLPNPRDCCSQELPKPKRFQTRLLKTSTSPHNVYTPALLFIHPALIPTRLFPLRTILTNPSGLVSASSSGSPPHPTLSHGMLARTQATLLLLHTQFSHLSCTCQ